MSVTEAGRTRHLHRLLSTLADALGIGTDDAIGVPVAIALRWEVRPQGFFLSGVPADLVDLVVRAAGGSFDDSAGSSTAIRVVDERWADDAIGTGPALTEGGDGRPLSVTAPGEEPDGGLSKLDQAKRLRANLRASSQRLATTLQRPIDPAPLLDAIRSSPRAAETVLRDLADSRRIVGRYLLDAADWFDDERIDQLGDGYVRVSSIWDTVAGEPGRPIVDDALALEDACANWMRGAAEPPTRYAF